MPLSMKVNLKTLTFSKILKKAPIVSLDGQPVLLFNQPHPSLLIALEHKKIQVFSECRNGYCGACKTKIISGSVTYHTQPLVTLKADECLPCCCTPTSDLDLNLSPEGADVVTRPGITTAVIALEQTKA